MSTETARADVLGKIRAAIGGVSDAESVRAEWAAIPRRYVRIAKLDRHAILDLLDDRLRDYDAQVVHAKAGEVSAAIGAMLAAKGKRRLVVPAGFAEMLGEDLPAGFDFVPDHGMSSAEIDAFEGVVTRATVAIAETGTIVLQNVPGQGRRVVSLVPDYHLCLVRAEDVVETVSEAMGRLQATASLATTFISGPSATADIEMTRIKGVHGPRFLDVIVVTG